MKIDFEAYITGESARIYEVLMRDKVPLKPALRKKIAGMIADTVIQHSIDRAIIFRQQEIEAEMTETTRDALIKPYLVDDPEDFDRGDYISKEELAGATSPGYAGRIWPDTATGQSEKNAPDPLPVAKPEYIG